MEIQSTKQPIDHPSQPAGTDLSECGTVQDRYILHGVMLRSFYKTIKPSQCAMFGDQPGKIIFFIVILN